MTQVVEYGDSRLPQSYWDNVYPEPTSGCWLWGGPSLKSGYGTTRAFGKKTTAHLVMLMVGGELSRSLVGMHLCDVPSCVRREHLKAASQSENLADMVSKGRHRVWNKSPNPWECPKCGGPRTPNKNSTRPCPQWYCPECSRYRRSKKRLSGVRTMSQRKRDDLPEQKLYRVVSRIVGSDDEWTPPTGYNRTYVTAGAARGMRTRLEGDQVSWFSYSGARGPQYEYEVQVAPVGEWEILP